MASLRDYQLSAVDATMAALAEHDVNPCLMLPTGAGKSVVLAELCHRLVSGQGKRVLMLTHVKELIEQNAKRLNDHWRELTGTFAPMGVYSAGLGKKQAGHPITYAGVQSIAGKIDAWADRVDVVIVDEVHLVPTKGEGRYRQVFSALPRARRVGLTATPWRLGHGSICEGEGALFSQLVTPDGASVRELVDAGYLSPLRSKHTDTQLLELVNGAGVHKRGGDFVESELAAAVDKAEPNRLIAEEVVRRGSERKHWLVFCVSVAHARAMAAELTSMGAPCGVVTGEMSSLERTDVLTRFRVGELRAVCNVNVLTTGYDFPDLDLLAFCRPTLSPVLYVQMAGRGMRLKSSGASDCLVLDFAGLVSTHGPITDVRPPKTKGAGGGECPVKPCPECSELVLISCMVCPSCGYEWPAPQKKVALHNDDIMGNEPQDVAHVVGWHWSQTFSKAGQNMLACEYSFAETVRVGERRVKRAAEFFVIWHPDPAGKFAREKLDRVISSCGATKHTSASMLIDELNARPFPETVKLKEDNGFVKIARKNWAKLEPHIAAE